MPELFGPTTPEDKPVSKADDTPDTTEQEDHVAAQTPAKKAAAAKKTAAKKDKDVDNDARAEFVDVPPNDNHPDNLKG